MGALRMLVALGWKAHLETINELLVVTIASIAPIALGGLFRWVRIDNAERSLAGYMHVIDELLERGELFMTTLAFVAVIFWHVVKEWPEGLKPPRVIFGIFCILSFGIISLFYSLDANKVAVHVESVLIFSKMLFGVTLVIYYISTLLTKADGIDYAAELARSSGALSSQLRKGRKP